MIKSFSLFASALALLVAPELAHAAVGPETVAALGGYAVGGVGLALAAKFWLERKDHHDRQADLDERLRSAEQTVAQLQSIRSENERMLAQKGTALADAQEQRDQSQEMLQTLRQQVERVARIDGLTGVANRQQFGLTLDAEIKRAVRQRKSVSLLFAELDFFGDYCDINGRDKGDHTLQRVASCVSDTFRRAGDLVARVGAAKFAVVLPEADGETGEKFAEKMRRRVYELCVPFPGSDAADRITVSVGIVTVPPNRLHDRDYVIAMAENALLHAQTNGHNRISMSAHAA